MRPQVGLRQDAADKGVGEACVQRLSDGCGIDGVAAASNNYPPTTSNSASQSVSICIG